MITRSPLSRLAVVCMTSALVMPAHAAAIFNFSEVGGDVVGILSGSLNVSGLSRVTVPSYGPKVIARIGTINASPCISFGNCNGDGFNLESGASNFGDGPVISATSASGDVFEISRYSVLLPVGYSGGSLSNTLTFANQTFASLGIRQGDYVYALPRSGDTVTVRFGAGSVPEPGTWMMAISGFALIGYTLRTRRRGTCRADTGRVLHVHNRL